MRINFSHISPQISISPRNLYGASNVCQHIYAIVVNNHLRHKRRWRWRECSGEKRRKFSPRTLTATLKWRWVQIFAYYRNILFILCILISDLNFIKTPRSIRTPFRNTEIMTARGFGKRNGENGENSEAESKLGKGRDVTFGI